MNDILQRAIGLLKHPNTSLGSAFIGLGSMGALAKTLGDTCAQLSHVHGLPTRLVTQLDSFGVAALAVSSVAIIICTNAHSVSNNITLGSGPPSPGGGQLNIVPLAQSGDLPQSSQQIDLPQKAA